MIFLDTDICIYLFADSHKKLTRRFLEQSAGSVMVSSITFAELAMGSVRGNPPPIEILNAFIAEVPLQAFDEAAARAYATLPFKRARFDRLLAAHALSVGAVIVTNNEADFADVPGLVVENWTV